MNLPPVELLVSVRNCDEIAAALSGGCDLLDFKEPQNGALGMVSSATLQTIETYCENQQIKVPLSMALGELVEWQERQEIPAIPRTMRYLKLGLSQIQGIADWNACWQDVTSRIETTRQKRYEWIAVAYADWEQADSVSPAEVLAAAIENRCAGLLIDTFSKQGTGLLDLLSGRMLVELIANARRANLKVALAGSIRFSDLESLAALQPDIIGIRGAACVGKRRTAPIQESAVRRFREQLDRQFVCRHSG
ncbi:hypothetical protein Pan153_37030 [Gimesia panareensis]|uniref:(5-formylfuran-3-yl)methyl phosphate synthase n=1 Tax=Gimesia panareensis TaxID=2527978 RepID=A0A518FRX0_9PLAN|nr:(5-formylfuran-3-yl)methyl phosphate synthase [Gimesia panareensis]QDV19040.1 hypothetical protein Pan153_37030 [Gimesia panareensis]